MRLATLVTTLLLLPCLGCEALKDADAYPDAGVAPADLGQDAPDVGVELDASADAGPRCPADPALRPEQRVPVDTEYTADVVWDCAHNWMLEGSVVVSGGTLTIEADTRVQVADRAFLLIGQGARLSAVGRVDAPIVFSPSTRPATRGQWRGVVLLGTAPTGFTSTSRVRETVADGRGAFGGGNVDVPRGHTRSTGGTGQQCDRDPGRCRPMAILLPWNGFVRMKKAEIPTIGLLHL